jgi:hypothetical protein
MTVAVLGGVQEGVHGPGEYLGRVGPADSQWLVRESAEAHKHSVTQQKALFKKGRTPACLSSNSAETHKVAVGLADGAAKRLRDWLAVSWPCPPSTRLQRARLVQPQNPLAGARHILGAAVRLQSVLYALTQ